MSKVKYTPFISGQIAGLKCELPDGTIEYIYLNPSEEETDDTPNVFLYQGATGDPAEDAPQHHYLIGSEEDE
jgi:hypothetical protein